MTRSFTASVWKEGEWYVAQCLEVDVASQGKTESEALDNLGEALKLHFTPPCVAGKRKVLIPRAEIMRLLVPARPVNSIAGKVGS